MKIIGITGGIGAGKTKVLNYLRDEKAAYIIEADRLAESIMQPGEEVFDQIRETFGDGITAADGTIDRMKLASIVYRDEESLARLNHIVHPAVKDWIRRDIDMKLSSGDVELYIIEAALLIQDGYREICDEIWYIHTPKDIRIERLIKGRGYTREKAEAIIANQPEDEYYIENSDRVIDNSKEWTLNFNKLLIFSSY